MENVCRLCANVKSSRQLTCRIDDETLNVVQKLIDCCRWNLIGANDCENLPQKICNMCFKQLEKCWEFAECVSRAQQQLLTQFTEFKPEIHFSSCIVIENDAQEETKYDVKISPNTFDSHNYTATMSEVKSEEYLKIDHSKPIINEVSTVDNNELLPEPISFLCETCGKNFSSKSNLNTHTKMHLPLASRKHYECYICKTTFSYKKSLIHHMPTHWGEKIQYECNLCELKFSRTDALRRHSLIHLGEQPHLCQTCGKKFRTKFNLKVKIELFFASICNQNYNLYYYSFF